MWKVGENNQNDVNKLFPSEVEIHNNKIRKTSI